MCCKSAISISPDPKQMLHFGGAMPRVQRSARLGVPTAGQANVEFSWLYEAMICPRCRRGCTKMVGGTRCVSSGFGFGSGVRRRGTADVWLRL
jgi:hypothetical protein